MTSEKFFEKRTEQSRVKAEIVSKYFDAWSNVIVSTQKKNARTAEDRIAYVDLFAGPGVYKDGLKSTPLLIVEKAIRSEDLSERLDALFNDKNPEFAAALENAIKHLDGYEKLRHKPRVRCTEIGADFADEFADIGLVPTLLFADPWGYKGLSLDLLGSVLKGWGSDGIVFFNYNRVSMALGRADLNEHIQHLYGKDRASDLQSRASVLTGHERETLLIQELRCALKERGFKYVRLFTFKGGKSGRTKHQLVFVSRHFIGMDIMRGIMARQSSKAWMGAPTYQHSPMDDEQPLLFSPSGNIRELQEMLLQGFAGRELRMKEIFIEHSVDQPYREADYKKALMQLEQEGKIGVTKHRKGSFGDDVTVTFPTAAD